MGVCEYDVHHIECTGVVPIFYQTLLVGNEHVDFVPTRNIGFPADGRHGAKTIDIIPKTLEQRLCKTRADILHIPHYLVLQFVRCPF